MKPNLPFKLNNARDQHSNHQSVEGYEKPEENRVVKFPDAGSQPIAVMVKAAHTVTAVLAVERFLGSKDVTGFAKFEVSRSQVRALSAKCSLALQG